MRFYKLTIHWQRLVELGQTCPRCSGTETEIDKAVDLLSRSLSVLGIVEITNVGQLISEKIDLNPYLHY